jgi:hypothetical protein
VFPFWSAIILKYVFLAWEGVMRMIWSLAIVVALAVGVGCLHYPKEAETNPAVKAQQFPAGSFDNKIEAHADTLLEAIFRFDTFGSEAFWGGKLPCMKRSWASSKEASDLVSRRSKRWLLA